MNAFYRLSPFLITRGLCRPVGSSRCPSATASRRGQRLAADGDRRSIFRGSHTARFTESARKEQCTAKSDPRVGSRFAPTAVGQGCPSLGSQYRPQLSDLPLERAESIYRESRQGSRDFAEELAGPVCCLSPTHAIP